jgi:hypothetical protein
MAAPMVGENNIGICETTRREPGASEPGARWQTPTNVEHPSSAQLGIVYVALGQSAGLAVRKTATATPPWYRVYSRTAADIEGHSEAAKFGQPG